MTLLEITNEVVSFVAQAVVFIFPIGIAIYLSQYKNWKEILEKYDVENIVMEQHQRVSGKITRLFFTGAGTVFYAIGVRVLTSQTVFSEGILWLLLSVAVFLLLLVFFFFYSILPEIGLIDG